MNKPMILTSIKKWLSSGISLESKLKNIQALRPIQIEKSFAPLLEWEPAELLVFLPLVHQCLFVWEEGHLALF